MGFVPDGGQHLSCLPPGHQLDEGKWQIIAVQFGGRKPGLAEADDALAALDPGKRVCDGGEVLDGRVGGELVG